MNSRELGKRHTAVGTAVITLGSLVGLGIAFSAVAATIPSLASTISTTDNGSSNQGGGLGNGFGSPHARSNGS